jgi:hypothetical protein
LVVLAKPVALSKLVETTVGPSLISPLAFTEN